MYIPRPFTEADLKLPLRELVDKSLSLSKEYSDRYMKIFAKIVNELDFWKRLVPEKIIDDIKIIHGEHHLENQRGKFNSDGRWIVNKCFEAYKSIVDGKEIGNPKLGDSYSVKEYSVFGIICKLAGRDPIEFRKIQLNCPVLPEVKRKVDIEYYQITALNYPKAMEIELKRMEDILKSKTLRDAIIPIFEYYTTFASLVNSLYEDWEIYPTPKKMAAYWFATQFQINEKK